MLKINKSSVHGFGLFSTTNIAKGTVLLNIIGEIKSTNDISDEVIAQGHWQGIRPGLALFPLAGERTLFSYINHSPKANAFVNLELLQVIATCDIQVDEEIYIDYRLEPYDDRCRRLIGLDVPEILTN